MLRRSPFLIICGAVLTALSFAPSDALAQHVSVGVGVHVAPGVVVGGGYHYPGHYHGGPHFYGSFYVGYPWYGGYYGYPYAYPYAAAYYAYPVSYYDPGASMRLQVTPRQTEVYVDGYFAGTVDDFDGNFQRLNLEPGEHEVQLYLPGHRIAVQRMYLQPGKTTKIKMAMEPLGPGEPEPLKPSAQDPAITPSRPRSSAPQDPAITPSRPRYSEQQDPAITPSRPSAGNGQPPRRPSPSTAPRDDVPPPPRESVSEGYGSVALRVQPGPAIVTIDGERWEGPQGNERFVVELPVGRHVIDVQKDGYRQYTTEVTVRPGETSAVNVALSKNQN